MKVKRNLQSTSCINVSTNNPHRYAEMDKAEKNRISHRFKALEKLKIWLQEEV